MSETTQAQIDAQNAAIRYLMRDELELLLKGKQIDAIKAVRERRSESLVAAKRITDAAMGRFYDGDPCPTCNGKGRVNDTASFVNTYLAPGPGLR